MAYTVAWNEASPLGSDPANTLHTIIQNKQIAIRERLAGIFGLTALEWAADPIVPKTLTLSTSLTVPTVIGNVTGNLTGTILTAAQANITNLGVLTSLTVNGFITSGAGGSYATNQNTLDFTGGAVDTRFRNAARSADNIIITNAGDITLRGTLSGITTLNVGTINTTGSIVSGFGYIQFRGTTAATGALRNVGGTLVEAVLADGSAYANFQANVITAAGFSGPLTGNVTGNLTGSVLTAAQANITSLGTLTSLTVSGPIITGPARIYNGTTTGVGVGVPTTIYTASNLKIIYLAVAGDNGAGKTFLDLVAVDMVNGFVTPIVQTILVGVPSARAYSISGTNVQLNMSAAATTVKVSPVEFV